MTYSGVQHRFTALRQPGLRLNYWPRGLACRLLCFRVPASRTSSLLPWPISSALRPPSRPHVPLASCAARLLPHLPAATSTLSPTPPHPNLSSYHLLFVCSRPGLSLLPASVST